MSDDIETSIMFVIDWRFRQNQLLETTRQRGKMILEHVRLSTHVYFSNQRIVIIDK